MYTHLVLLSSLLALSSASCAVDNHSISEVSIHQTNLIPRDPHAMNIEGWAAKANRVIPTWSRVARATQSSAICGPNFYEHFTKIRPKLPYRQLRQRSRRCKRYCKCETVPGYNNKELTCQKDLEPECRRFCVCEAPGPDYYRKGVWGHEIASTEGWESSSADKAMNEARMEEVRSRSSPSSSRDVSAVGEMDEVSSSVHDSANGETDEVGSRSSWETVDSESAEVRRKNPDFNYMNRLLQADAATRSGRIRYEESSRSSSSGHESADGETDEESSRLSWETVDSDSSEARRMIANSNYISNQLQAEAATRSGRIKLGHNKSRYGRK